MITDEQVHDALEKLSRADLTLVEQESLLLVIQYHKNIHLRALREAYGNGHLNREEDVISRFNAFKKTL